MHHIGSDEEDSQDGHGHPQVQVGRTWEAIGPFPSGMREHPLMATPLAAYTPKTDTLDSDVDFARRPYDGSEWWFSELGNGGKIGWKKFETGEGGWTEVSYPEIKWDQLRLDHGWASLQHQVLLRTAFTVPSLPGHELTPILVDFIQCTEYAFIPQSGDVDLPITWYNGDVYAFGATPIGTRNTKEGGTSNFARSVPLAPGEYICIVRAMYEIRMFGDPGIGNPPVIKMKIQVELPPKIDQVELISGTTIFPDVVDGWLMGEYVSVAVRAPTDQGVRLKLAEAEDDQIKYLQDLGISIESVGLESSVFPGKTRPLSWIIRQTSPFKPGVKSITIPLRVTFGDHNTPSEELKWKIQLKCHESTEGLGAFKMTFPSPHLPVNTLPAMVSYAMVIPPKVSSKKEKSLPPVMLATHGAGVDAEWEAWIKEIPVMDDGWAVLPTGKNEWGEDWHGGSMDDAWASREALKWVAEKLGKPISDETLLIGHSNGGQGAWHLAARYFDRIAGVLAASGWLTIQDYVPYTELVSNHQADPALMGILKSSLTPYNNDLHASNLVNIPILALHGSDDNNVPPRHSRAHISLISSWQSDTKGITYIEVPEKGHFWKDMFRSEEVKRWIEDVCNGKIRKGNWDEQRKQGFTLSCGNPDECGGRAGIRILELAIPGRLARLDVNARQWRDRASFPLDLRGMNIKRISVSNPAGSTDQLEHNGTEFITLPDYVNNLSTTPTRRYGPMIRILATSAPIILVYGDNPRTRGIASRLAHDLYVYHRLDVITMDDQEALERLANGTAMGNIVAIGDVFENIITKYLLSQKTIPLDFPTKGVMIINDKLVYESGAGIITLCPHPISSMGLAMIIAGNDDQGLELATRLFPIRTGVPIPDWAIVCPRAKWQAAGGLVGAGFWNGDWKWSEGMSWMDR